MPPPAPSYIPPASATETTQSHYGAPPNPQYQNASAYDQNSAYRTESLQYSPPSPYNISAGYGPVAPPAASTTDIHHENRQQVLVRDGNGGFILKDVTESETQPYSRATEDFRPDGQHSAPSTSNYTHTQPSAPHEHPTIIQPAIHLPATQESNYTDAVHAKSGVPEYVNSVEQSMSNLTLGGPPTGPPETESRTSRKPKRRIQLPPILADGPGQEVVRFCPEDRQVDYQLYWYYLADLPDSPICTRCHADHIESTSLAAKFSRKRAEPETVLSCHFRYSRVQNIIWPKALKTGSLEELKSFLSSRLQVPNCKGRNATSGNDGIKYFGMRNEDINGFIACEACLSDHITGTAFESQFVPYSHVQGKTDRWTCDMSIPYIRKAVAKFSERNDWPGFIEGTSRRCKLPACEGKPLNRADCANWYTTRRKMEKFQICEACYMDKIELGIFASELAVIPGSADFDEYIEFLRQIWTCSLTGDALPMMFALDAAENKEDFAAFHKSASAIVQLVPCTKHGIIRGNWWTLKGGCNNFDICEACYEGIMKPNELDQFLESKQCDPEATIVCDFCTAAPRFNEYLAKFCETLDRSIFSCYGDHVRTFAAVPACPRREHLEKSHWWGYGEALFCENCYLVFVKHTSLSEHMPLQGEYDERAQICQIWSPRMRNMWRAVCDAGAPGSTESNNELIKFRAFGAKRLEVYLATVPRINFIRGMKEIKMMQAMQQGQLSLMYQGMNSMAVLSGTDDGNLHGNSSIGWYETENGATGAQMFNNMQSGMADANRGDEWMQIFQLEILWQEVE